MSASQMRTAPSSGAGTRRALQDEKPGRIDQRNDEGSRKSWGGTEWLDRQVNRQQRQAEAEHAAGRDARLPSVASYPKNGFWRANPTDLTEGQTEGGDAAGGGSAGAVDTLRSGTVSSVCARSTSIRSRPNGGSIAAVAISF